MTVCQILLQNAIANLLQNETEVHYKIRQVFYHKMLQLLQNVTFFINCDSTWMFFSPVKKINIL